MLMQKDQGYLFKNGYIEKVKARRKTGRKGGRDYKMDQDKKE